METDKKLEKKKIKEAKRAEKLEKLRKKESNWKLAPSKPKEKKSSKEHFDSSIVEKHWVAYWKKNNVFKAIGDGSANGVLNTANDNSCNISDLAANTTNIRINDTRINKHTFSMILPPPNITGSLHIGHAMMVAIEDSIVRYKRLNGYDVLYVPGLDHAGIATQNVVMKKIGSKCGREEFMTAAQEWSGEYGERICEQMERLGCSVDHTRRRFTLDEGASQAVNKAFKLLYERGLIFREKKIVNWCGRLRTSVSDLEVVHRDIKGGTMFEVDGGMYRMGMMYYVRYELTRGQPNDKKVYVVIGTTRPETILGDTGLCINMQDSRFAVTEELFLQGGVIGIDKICKRETGVNDDRVCKSGCVKENESDSCVNNCIESTQVKSVESTDHTVLEMKKERKAKYKKTKSKDVNDNVGTRASFYALNPLTGRKIPVVFDEHAELGFGTGVLKLTPFHDVADFELGKKHGLDFVRVFDEENRVVILGQYCGMRRFEAREAVLRYLREKGDLVGEEKHDMVVPFCSRSNDIIEPTVREQWWLRCDKMAERASAAVKDGEIVMHPPEAVKIWEKWLNGIRDWCLSRQLWWGHRVPAWRCTKLSEKNDQEKVTTGFTTNIEELWVVAENKEEAEQQAAERGLKIIGQDEDVLDTWFSSGLWPFSSLGWPKDTEDLRKHFPNSVLETGSDILFFWVARMVMLSYELLDTRPFDHIVLHGIVRDSHGRKMSKSLGNVVDPVYVIDGITLDKMVAGLKLGNLDARELKVASEGLRKDFPRGIGRCGADALRFALLSYSNGMRDINLDILRVEGYAKFCNKIHNAYSFIKHKLTIDDSNGDINYRLNNLNIVNSDINNGSKIDMDSNPDNKLNNTNSGINSVSKADIRNNTTVSKFTSDYIIETVELLDHQKWILERLNALVKIQHENMEKYNFMVATQKLYEFFFYTFCDVFLEVTKKKHNNDTAVLVYVFTRFLVLLNPFMPFVTEEYYFKLQGSVLSSSPWYPVVLDRSFLNDFDGIVALARLCRTKSVEIENHLRVVYLDALAHSKFTVVDVIKEDAEVLGGVKYRVLE